MQTLDRITDVSVTSAGKAELKAYYFTQIRTNGELEYVACLDVETDNGIIGVRRSTYYTSESAWEQVLRWCRTYDLNDVY